MKNLLFVLFVATVSTSYSQFTLSGEFRPRTEYRHGFMSVSDSNQQHAIFTDQRTRLNLAYKAEGYQVKMVLQDIRVWGSQKQLVSTMDNSNQDGALTGIHEAWGETFLNVNWSLKFGRQEISYDDQRIFGSVGWAQQARSHDAIMFKYQKDGIKLDIAGAYNQDKVGLIGTSASTGSYKAFQSVWLHKPFGDNVKMSLLFLNLGKQANDTVNNTYWDNYTQTIGTHTEYKKDKLKICFNGYYQMGKTNATKAKNVGAYNLGLDINYKLSDQLTAMAGFEMLSGNSQTKTDSAYIADEHAFNPYFGTNHKFNGFMDYFYVGNHISNVGLNDFYVKLKYKKEKKFIQADWHMFMANADVQDSLDMANVAMNANLGMEIDLSFGAEISKDVTLKGGYSHMLPSATLASLKGVVYNTGDNIGMGRIDQISNWAYLMIIIKPTFLKTKKENKG